MTTNRTPVVVERVHLICTEGSYKFYDIELLRFGEDLYQAVGYNGRIVGEPSDPQSGKPRPQSLGPVSYAEARLHFDALEKSKRREYSDNPHKPRYVAGDEQAEAAEAAPPTLAAAPAEARKERTGVRGYLPKPVEDERALDLVYDDSYDASQKLDGEKQYATLRDGDSFGTNKLGNRIMLPAAVRRDLALLARAADSANGVTLDGEQMGAYFVYDLLELRGADLRAAEYRRRQDELLCVAERFEAARREEGLPGEPAIRFVRKAVTTADKLTLMRVVQELQLEGAVFANLLHPGQLFKWKQWRTLDVVAVANPAKRSVTGYVYHGGVLQPVGSINISEERYRRVLEIESRGGSAVSEVKCLYSSGDADARGQLQQASVMRVRDDKLPEQCTGDQLKWCVTRKVVIDWTQYAAA
jgi:hypothetical protein